MGAEPSRARRERVRRSPQFRDGAFRNRTPASVLAPGTGRKGAAHGPFDVTLIQTGAYSPAWPDIHMTPEETVAARIDLRGELLIPVHWGTYILAFHSWADPVDRLWRDEGPGRPAGRAAPRRARRRRRPAGVDGWWQVIA